MGIYLGGLKPPKRSQFSLVKSGYVSNLTSLSTTLDAKQGRPVAKKVVSKHEQLKHEKEPKD